MPTKEASKIEKERDRKESSLRALFVVSRSAAAGALRLELAERGFDCPQVIGDDDVIEEICEQAPDIVLIAHDKILRELARKIKEEKPLPVLGLLTGFVRKLALEPDIDDFAFEPFHADEIELRIKRLLLPKQTPASGETLEIGDLAIDLAKCEVSVGGNMVVLTFKEYELLKFLVSNRGRVFSRESLLDRVWGYNYFGGDRTVDVHVRRLRSKIEDSKHSFIETVRSIGYRFKQEE